MATGYTYDVGDGKVSDFRTFALRCSRAFGATIMQRDDPMEELPQHREETSFYADELVKAEAEAAHFASLTLAEAEQEMKGEAVDAIARRAAYQADKDAKRLRYDAMLAEVNRWGPPTGEHIPLQAFMRDQIAISIDHDCSDFLWPELPIASAVEWLAAKRAGAEKSVARLRDEIAQEHGRCEKANAWIDALYASLDRSEAVPLADRSEP